MPAPVFTLFAWIGRIVLTAFDWYDRLFVRQPHKSERQERIGTHRAFLALALTFLVAGLWGLQHMARIQVNAAEAPILWTVATISLLVLTKLPLLLFGLGLVVVLFLAGWRWYYASVAGKHAVHHHRLDSTRTRDVKFRNAATIQAALVVGIFLFVGLALFSVR